jgi:hypothetical protein
LGPAYTASGRLSLVASLSAGEVPNSPASPLPRLLMKGGQPPPALQAGVLHRHRPRRAGGVVRVSVNTHPAGNSKIRGTFFERTDQYRRHFRLEPSLWWSADLWLLTEGQPPFAPGTARILQVCLFLAQWLQCGAGEGLLPLRPPLSGVASCSVASNAARERGCCLSGPLRVKGLIPAQRLQCGAGEGLLPLRPPPCQGVASCSAAQIRRRRGVVASPAPSVLRGS